MPKLTIDGREVEVAPGTNIVDAAKSMGIDVPTYCYHPALTVAASCRICQVELHADEGPPRVVVGCQTQCADGMKVSTVGDDCKKARAATLEFLLANHPLDCPICDKAGECDLQDFSYRHGNAAGRFTEQKRQGVKREPIGDHILLDQERCILCTRCVRFMDEYAHAPSLVVTGRGDRNVISIFPGQPMRSNYEGNLADICPVGALTLQEFHHKSRVWDLQHHDSVCTLCDRGCSIRLETKRNRLIRVRPRENQQVNGYFMCDVGRFGLLKECNPEHRVTGARAAAGALEGTAAFEALVRSLQEHAGRCLVVLSARLTAEEIFLARRALTPLSHGQRLMFVPVTEEGGDDILFTGRRAANEAALRSLQIGGVTGHELALLLRQDDVRAALFFDAALAAEVQARAHLDFLAVHDVWNAEHAAPEARPADADLFLPGLLHSEKSGTFLNVNGVLQRVRQAQRPPPGTFAEADCLRALADRLAPDAEPLEGPDATADLCRALRLDPRTLNQIPATGWQLQEAPVA